MKIFEEVATFATEFSLTRLMCFCEAASGLEMNGAFEGLPDEKAQGKAFVWMDEAHIPVSALMNSRGVFLTFSAHQSSLNKVHSTKEAPENSWRGGWFDVLFIKKKREKLFKSK